MAVAQCRIHNNHMSLNVIVSGILWLIEGCISAVEMVVRGLLFEKDMLYYYNKEGTKSLKNLLVTCKF